VKRLVALVVGLALCGCVTPGSVALLSDEGGGVGAVAVIDPKSGAERGQLTAPNTQAPLSAGPLKPKALTGNYDALLAVMPPAPRVFTLYFANGVQLTPESQRTLEELRRLITPASEVQITGHTDTVGGAASNDRLSLDRATQVREALVAQGLPVANAKVTGRGEREPRVPTADNVSEAANRRVDLIIR